MTAIRTCIQDFGTANNLYVNAVVTFYKVLNGEKTNQKATLYSSITGDGRLSNPQTLDSFGKFKVPVYIEEAVIATITGLENVEDHDTGIVSVLEEETATSPEDVFEFIGVVIETASNKSYKLIINSPFAGVFHSITTVCATGTCTITGKINGTDLGGNANSVSTSEVEEEHEEDNVFNIGDDFEIEISGNSSCEDISVTIKYTRT